MFFRYRAAVIGEGEQEIEKILDKRYKPNMSVQEGLALGIQALSSFIGNELNVDRLEAVYIDSNERKFVQLPNGELNKFLSKIRK